MLPLLIPALLGAPSAPAGTPAELRTVLDTQVAAWNRGDLEGYLQGYWASPQLRFVGSRGLLHGIDALRAHYRRGRPEGSAFGTLAFTDLAFEPLGEAWLVTGSYVLKGDKPGTGRFTLLFRRIPKQGWRIVYDHSS